MRFCASSLHLSVFKELDELVPEDYDSGNEDDKARSEDHKAENEDEEGITRVTSFSSQAR